jgi:hypothetical protein
MVSRESLHPVRHPSVHLPCVSPSSALRCAARAVVCRRTDALLHRDMAASPHLHYTTVPPPRPARLTSLPSARTIPVPDHPSELLLLLPLPCSRLTCADPDAPRAPSR